MKKNKKRKKLPKTVDELFPWPWLHVDDLNGRTVTVTIHGVEFDEFPKRPGAFDDLELKGILDFRRSKKLILNKTQALEIQDVLGTKVFAEWIGRKITLKPGVSHTGQPTIKITNPPAPEADQPQPEPNGDGPDVVTSQATPATSPVTTEEWAETKSRIRKRPTPTTKGPTPIPDGEELTEENFVAT